jgi:hypothetical protein
MDSRVIDWVKSLESDQGELTPEVVEEKARDPKSPGHDYFEWDDAVAGYRHRLDQARTLIKTVKVEIVTTDMKLLTPHYIPDPNVPVREQGYISVYKLRTDRESAMAALHNEVDRLRGILRRTREVAASLNLSKEAEVMIRDVI